MDYTTLNLKRAPIAKIAPTYEVSRSMGQGCMMDPPGYPSYFLRSVYTAHGNSPRKGTQEVIRDEAGNDRAILGADDYNRRSAILRSFWSPLPIDHPRTQAWVRYVYGYMTNMYRNDEAPEGRRYNVSEMVSKNASNADRCTPEASAAVNMIRKFYPEHQPDPALLDNRDGYGSKGGGSWWETEAERPAPHACKPRSCGPHPVNGNWCQWCGWVKEG